MTYRERFHRWEARMDANWQSAWQSSGPMFRSGLAAQAASATPPSISVETVLSPLRIEAREASGNVFGANQHHTEGLAISAWVARRGLVAPRARTHSQSCYADPSGALPLGGRLRSYSVP